MVVLVVVVPILIALKNAYDMANLDRIIEPVTQLPALQMNPNQHPQMGLLDQHLRDQRDITTRIERADFDIYGL